MKILRVIPSMNPALGGPSQGIRNSIPELKKLGILTEVACQDDSEENFLKTREFTIHALGPSIGPWRYSSKLLPWLLENISRFDIVIVHGLWLYHSYAVWKTVKKLERQKLGKQMPKLFIMPHGMLDPWFQNANGREWKALRNWIYWKIIESKVVNDAHGLLFTCETELLLAKKSFPSYHPKREINIGYGISEPPPFTNYISESFLKKCPDIRNQSYILFLSRIHYKKGIDLLIKAYANIIEVSRNKKKIPKLIIAGPGMETPYGKKIIQLVEKNPDLINMVYFTGMLTGDAKWGALYNCEAFVLPSHQENFGIAVVEAMACGKPVLISNQINIWREISHDGSGIIGSDSIEGTEKILQSWFNLTFAQQLSMGETARITFEKRFAIEIIAKQFSNALNQ